MLGLAKREIITERVESLLKIGLGPLGMVGLVMAPADDRTTLCSLDIPALRFNAWEAAPRRSRVGRQMAFLTCRIPHGQDHASAHGQPGLHQAAKHYRVAVSLTAMVIFINELC